MKYMKFLLMLMVIAMSSPAPAMTLREKVGQLFMIRPDQLDPSISLEEIVNDKASAKGTKSVNRSMLTTLKDYPAGGFVIFRKNIDTPVQLRKLNAALKSASKISPLIAVDEEGGRIARLANHKAFKLKKYSSAEEIAKSGQVRQASEYIASYLKYYGFNMNFAPVADINTNPENVVIGDRAFGSDPHEVSRNVSDYFDGLHSQGIAGSLKHFPGHGDTKDDTHSGYVAVHKTWPELLKSELIPFRENLAKADSVMIAHITMKNVTTDDLPATLSHELITGKLRDELGYDGVVIADALMMKAIRNHYTSGEAAIMALEAGCDILLMPYDYREAFDGIIGAVKSGRISEARIDQSVKRIMKLKERYAMRAQRWWQTGAVYQIYPASFADTTGTGRGDLRGIIAHLDYLQKLGVNAVWLTPVYPSPMVDNGYDISDYTGIDPRFGTMSDFDELILEAGKRGIKIVMDLVFNHSSDQHEWFLLSKSSRDNPKADWYIWRDPKPDGSAPTNWRSIFGGSAWTFCPERGQYYLHTFAVEQPDLNWENPAVRRALYEAANFWLKKGVGGFRIDAIVYIKKPAEFRDGDPDSAEGSVNIHNMTANQPGILEFLHEFKREVRDGHDIFTVGEANGVSPDQLPEWVGENGVFDMLFEFSHQTLEFGESEIWCKPVEWKLTDLKRALSDSQRAVEQNGWYPAYWENHDQPRSVNHFFPEGADREKAAKVLAAILLTLRGTPFIYQGEELGMTNRNWRDIGEINDVQTRGQYDLALKEGFSEEEAMKFVRRFTRDNARTPMQWDSSENAGFTSGVSWLPVNENYVSINAEREENAPNSVLNWYRKLLAFRKSSEVLLRGTYREIMSESEEVFGFVREFNGEALITLANFSAKPVKLPEALAQRRVLFSSETALKASELKPLEARICQ